MTICQQFCASSMHIPLKKQRREVNKPAVTGQWLWLKHAILLTSVCHWACCLLLERDRLLRTTRSTYNQYFITTGLSAFPFAQHIVTSLLEVWHAMDLFFRSSNECRNERTKERFTLKLDKGRNWTMLPEQFLSVPSLQWLPLHRDRMYRPQCVTTINCLCLSTYMLYDCPFNGTDCRDLSVWPPLIVSLSTDVLYDCPFN